MLPVRIPSYCSRCEHSFDHTSLEFTVGETDERGSIKTMTVPCPKCNGAAQMLSRNMRPITRKMIEDFALLTHDAEKLDMPLPQYTVKAAKIHPAFPYVIFEYVKKHPIKAMFYGAMTSAITACSLDGNKLLDQTGVAQVIKERVLAINDNFREKQYLEQKQSDNVDKNLPTSKPNAAAKATGKKAP